MLRNGCTDIEQRYFCIWDCSNVIVSDVRENVRSFEAVTDNRNLSCQRLMIQFELCPSGFTVVFDRDWNAADRVVRGESEQLY